MDRCLPGRFDQSRGIGSCATLWATSVILFSKRIHAPCSILGVLISFSLGWSVLANATDAVPKQVHLIVEHDRLVASNVPLSRFDELRFKPKEKIVKKATSKAAIVVVTNQRIIGYGILSGWRPIPTRVDEKAERISAEDSAGLVITNKRILNFNGQSGVWGQIKRPVDKRDID